MKTRSLKLYATIAATAGLLAFGAVSRAQAQSNLEARVQAGVKKLEAACSEDLKKYCSTVTPGEGRLYFCVQAHEDKISAKCDYALFEASRNLDRALDRVEQAADACWSDIEEFCAKSPAGEGRIMQCLTAKKASLKPACQTVVSKFPSGK